MIEKRCREAGNLQQRWEADNGGQLAEDQVTAIEALHEQCPDFGVANPTRCDCQHKVSKQLKESAIN